MKFAIVSVAGLAMATTASAQSFDLTGVQVDGVTPVMVGSITSSVAVTGVQFDLIYQAGVDNASWGSELNIDVIGPGGVSAEVDGNDADFSDDGPDDLTFGWPDSSGTFTGSGTVSISGSAGTYDIFVFDTFDDGGIDGEFLSSTPLQGGGSTITLVPTPGAAAILGMGGLVATRRRR